MNDETWSNSVGSDRRTLAEPPEPFLFVVLECARPLAAPSRHALAGVEEVVLGRGPSREAVRSMEGGRGRLVLRVPDRWMSSLHARLVRAEGRWLLEDAGSKNGLLVNGVPQRRTLLTDGDVVELGHTLLVLREALPAAKEGPADVEASPGANGWGLSSLVPSLAKELSRVAQLARAGVPLILEGETGTGKEVVARACHELTGRSGPFVAVNCGALPANLVETELFGYRKGAFSGATEDRPGLVRSADRGTLFLDELGELPAASQVAFLRVLQEREVLPVGATRPVKVDFRVMAATHRELNLQVAQGTFRADLLARLSGHVARLPPLRRRKEDLGLFLGVLLRRVAPGRAEALSFTPEAARALWRYAWPHNVRELERCLEAAVALATREIGLEHLPPTVRGDAPAPGSAGDRAEADRRGELESLLREHGGNVSAVARALGTSRAQVHRLAQRFGIELRGARG